MSSSEAYRDAGVDLEAQDRALVKVKKLARSTFTKAVLSDVGSFGGLFRLDLGQVQEPVLVASADGVGTTLMVARYAVNTLKEVETSLSRFEQNGIDVKGVILNSIFRRATGYQDYGYYEYEYKSDSK